MIITLLTPQTNLDNGLIVDNIKGAFCKDTLYVGVISRMRTKIDLGCYKEPLTTRTERLLKT